MNNNTFSGTICIPTTPDHVFVSLFVPESLLTVKFCTTVQQCVTASNVATLSAVIEKAITLTVPSVSATVQLTSC